MIRKVTEVVQKFPRSWDGREAVRELKEADYNWRQSEWPGFYFQFLCRNYLGEIMEIPGRAYEKGDFDGFAEVDWDFKTHSVSDSGGRPKYDVILNDADTIDESILRNGKLYFLIAKGKATWDLDGSFKEWHDALKGGLSKYSIERASQGRPSRRLKTSFSVESFDLIRIDSSSAGLLATFQQGRNSNGRPRPVKYLMDTREFLPVVSIGV